MAEAPNVVLWGGADPGGGSTIKSTLEAVHDGIVDFNVTGIITTSEDAGVLDHARLANTEFGMDIETLIIEGKAGKRQSVAGQLEVLRFLNQRHTHTLALMGCMVIMGSELVTELNGDVPEQDLPHDLEGAQRLMLPADDMFGTVLPKDFPQIEPNGERFGLLNTHPAPTIVTANTYGLGAQERMIQLWAAQSAQTLHAVGHKIDTGAILAANKFPTTPVPRGTSGKEITIAARRLFKQVQRIEKAHLPLDLATHLLKRQFYLEAS